MPKSRSITYVLSRTQERIVTLKQFINKIKTSPVEKFGVVYLGADHKTCIGVKILASGNAGCIRRISVDKILHEAQRLGARGMILVHNHPRTGQDKLRPSEADLHTTFTIHDITKTFGVPVLNHIIYGANNSTFSFIHNGIEI